MKNDPRISDADRTLKAADIEDRIENMGGRRSYQDASILSTNIFRSSKWVLGRIEKLGMRERLQEGGKLR